MRSCASQNLWSASLLPWFFFGPLQQSRGVPFSCLLYILNKSVMHRYSTPLPPPRTTHVSASRCSPHALVAACVQERAALGAAAQWRALQLC